MPLEKEENTRNQEIHKLVMGTFNTETGKVLLTYLKETLVDRPVYKKGLSFDEVSFREGQRDAIMQLIKEVNKGGLYV